MSSGIRYEIRSVKTLTSSERQAIVEMIREAGFRVEEGYLEATHYVHNPILVLAWEQQRLIGLQCSTPYGRQQTPLSRLPVWFFCGELAFQHPSAAGRGIAHRLSVMFMRHWLGPLWFLRRYAFMTQSPNPRLMHLLSVQHRLYLPDDPALTPAIVNYMRQFAIEVRQCQQPIDDRLVVAFPPADGPSDISGQWARMFQARDERFNHLAFDLDLISRVGDRYVLSGKELLVIGRSSNRRLVQAAISSLFRRKTATSAAQSRLRASGTAPST